MVRKLLLCMVAFFIGMATCPAQEVVGDSATFTTEKAGKLEKAIKKMETGNITKIRIIGDVNQEDLLSLQAFFISYFTLS